MKFWRLLLIVWNVAVVGMAQGHFSSSEKAKVAEVFQGEKACFLLRAPQSSRYSVEVNQALCQSTVLGNEGLLLPLSVVAAERGLIQDEKTLFKWDGIKHSNPSWNKDQFVTEWLQNRVGWVTDRLLLQIGESSFHADLNRFSWKTRTSLKDLNRFSETLFLGKLPVKPAAQQLALRLFYIGKYRFGSEVWGQKGAGLDQAWFTGHIRVKNEDWIFTSLLARSKSQEPLTAERAQALAMDALTQLELF